jgi:hypothetical protein
MTIYEFRAGWSALHARTLQMLILALMKKKRKGLVLLKILDSLIKEIMRHYLKVQVHVFYNIKIDLKLGKIQDRLKGKASRLPQLVMN